MSQTVTTWWKSLGPVAKSTLCLSLFLTASSVLNFTHPSAYVADWEAILTRGELWRCLTSIFFLGTPDIHFFFGLFFLVDYQNRLERDFSCVSDHVHLNCFLGLGGLCTSYFWGLPYVSHVFLMALLSVWCWNHAGDLFKIYFFTTEARFYPLLVLCVNYAATGELLQGVAGLSLGSLYCLLRYSVPRKYGVHPLRTPRWFVALSSGLSAKSNVVVARGRQAFDSHQIGFGWGKGRRLGECERQ